ncbi:Ku protein [Gryllotalpicola koreensis]|uniref:Non-homologous end joining protein Ku n=2 Tax=Gryllotalpicola koreensis TaxID=993086 RepID=A0ABP8AC27_9MICO
MRAIGKRSISFGLVSVPVKIYTATEDHDIALHQVHDKDGGRIHYERRCDVCGKVIPFEHIDRAYDSGDRTVLLDEDDLESLPEASRDDVEVVEFVPSDQLDPITFERSYYLEPEKGGVKAYVLLRRTLERTDRTAIVRFALRNKTHLGALRVHEDGVMVLQSLLWGDEVRDADFSVLAKPPRVTPKEQELADSLVKSLESDFRPADYKDEYQEELQKLIDAKLKKGDDIDTAATFGEEPEEDEGEGAEVVDLMEALRRSVDKKRSSRSGGRVAAKRRIETPPSSGNSRRTAN